MVVRPRDMDFKFAKITASLSGSRALVASSRMKNRRLFQQRPRNSKSLTLTARQVIRALFEHGRIAQREALNKPMSASELSRSYHLLQRRMRLNHSYILADGSPEEEVLLQHDPYLAPQVSQIHLLNIVAIQGDQAAVVGIKTLNQTRYGGFAGAAPTDDPDRLTGLHPQRNSIKRRPIAALIIERDLFELDLAA